MSLKRMITKVALAFAAKKGVEMLRDAGGIKGVRDMFAPGTTPASTQPGGMSGRIGGTRSSSAGGLGNLLGSLGIAGATGPRKSGTTGQISPNAGSSGAMLGQLASAIGFNAASAQFGQSSDAQPAQEADLDRKEGAAIIRAIVQVARADGHVDEEEKEALLDLLDDANEDERSILVNALSEPVDASRVAADTPSHAAQEVYAAAAMIAERNNDKEQAYLSELAEALHLDAQDRTRIHTAMNTPSAAA